MMAVVIVKPGALPRSSVKPQRVVAKAQTNASKMLNRSVMPIIGHMEPASRGLTASETRSRIRLEDVGGKQQMA
jgi:hypothetical protein